MKITGHRTGSVFERSNITDHTDSLEAGRKAGKFLAKEHKQRHRLNVKLKGEG